MEFGRIAAQTAKQVIGKKVREASAKGSEEFEGRVGPLLSGVVKRVDRNGVFGDRRNARVHSRDT